MKTDKKSSRKNVVIIISAAVLVIAAAAIIMAVCGVFNPPAPKEEAKGVVGVITDDWDPNATEDPSAAKKSGTRIPGYSSAEMSAGDTSLTLSIGNPKENKVGMFAELQLEDGSVLYESPLLSPGQGLTEVPLNKTLDKGVYNAKVGFDGYNGIVTRRWPQGQPNVLIARACESGSSAMLKQPFARKAINGQKKRAQEAMGKAVNEEIDKITGGT